MHSMGVHSLDHWDSEPRLQRLPASLRADKSKNRVKFDKVHSSLARLTAGSHIHRKRIQRVMQLSTMGPLRIAPDTVMSNDVARPIDMCRHRESRLMQDTSDIASMTPQDLDDARMFERRSAQCERMMKIAEALMTGYEDEQLAKAEEFVGVLDERSYVWSPSTEDTDSPHKSKTSSHSYSEFEID